MFKGQSIIDLGDALSIRSKFGNRRNPNAILFILSLVIISCIGCVKEKNSSKLSPGKTDFDKIYQEWKSVESEYRHFSKMEPIKKLPQYKAFLALDPDSIDDLERVLRADDGLDFVLADVVIHLSNWDANNFDMGDLGKRRRQVLKRLEDNKNGDEKKVSAASQWLTNEEVDAFYALEGESAEKLRKLFGAPSKVDVEGDQEVWHYPHLAICKAKIDKNGIVVSVYYDAGF